MEAISDREAKKSDVAMSLGVVSVMVNWEEASGHNPHFYCLLTGFPATQPALSGIALRHESLTSLADDGKMISPTECNYSGE